MGLALATSPVRPMRSRTLVPDAGEVTLHELKTDVRSRLVMVLRPVGEESRCPGCGRPSRRVHSRYKRQLADLPWEGVPVSIELRVRRFFCSTDGCSQHIFTERLPNTVRRHARRTYRLSIALDRITLALGGSAGARLAQQLGIVADGSTLLRGLRQRTRPFPSSSPRVVGIDDWAWRKGQRYGTILCDLERGKVIDLLPDRSADSTGAWLRAHPGIEIVSRDRASLYAEAASKAAPHAVQVADRWHLLRNLTEALVSVLAPHHRVIDQAARTSLREQCRRQLSLPYRHKHRLSPNTPNSSVVIAGSIATNQSWNSFAKASRRGRSLLAWVLIAALCAVGHVPADSRKGSRCIAEAPSMSTAHIWTSDVTKAVTTLLNCGARCAIWASAGPAAVCGTGSNSVTVARSVRVASQSPRNRRASRRVKWAGTS